MLSFFLCSVYVAVLLPKNNNNKVTNKSQNHKLNTNKYVHIHGVGVHETVSGGHKSTWIFYLIHSKSLICCKFQ